MAHQETVFGQLRTLEAPKASEFGSIQKPPGFVGFVPFHLQQGQQQQRHALASPSRPVEPALSLSLDRSVADVYVNSNNSNNVTLQQKYQHQITPFWPSAHRPFDVSAPLDETRMIVVKSETFRSFDLKQEPVQVTEEEKERSNSVCDSGSDVKPASLSNSLPQLVAVAGSNIFQASKNDNSFNSVLAQAADDGNYAGFNGIEPEKLDGEFVSVNDASNEGKAGYLGDSTGNTCGDCHNTEDMHETADGNDSVGHITANSCDEGNIINETAEGGTMKDSTTPAKTQSDWMQDSREDAGGNTKCKDNYHAINVAENTEVAEGNTTCIDTECVVGDAEFPEGDTTCIDNTVNVVNDAEFNEVSEGNTVCNEIGDGGYATNTKTFNEGIGAANIKTSDDYADGNQAYNGSLGGEYPERDVPLLTPYNSNSENQPSYDDNTINRRSNIIESGKFDVDPIRPPGHEDIAPEHPEVPASFTVHHATKEQPLNDEGNTVKAWKPDFQSSDPQQSVSNQIEQPQDVSYPIFATQEYGTNNVEVHKTEYGDHGNIIQKNEYKSHAIVIHESEYDAQAMETDQDNMVEVHQTRYDSSMLDSQPMDQEGNIMEVHQADHVVETEGNITEVHQADHVVETEGNITEVHQADHVVETEGNITEIHQADHVVETEGNITEVHQADHVVETEIPIRSHHAVIPSKITGVPTYELGVIDNGALSQKSDATQHGLCRDQQLYPPALAAHSDVVQNAELFMATLGNFHASIGTRLTALKFGDKEMSLHKFYCEVTSRGGLEQVLRAGLWKDVSQALDISSTPFTLRKQYMNQLFHYEQVYFFRAEGQLRVPPTPILAPSPVESMPEVGSLYEVAPEIASTLKKKKRKLDPMQIFGADPASSIGSIATGAITGKFNEGYLITVVLGTEKLYGVLYHTPEEKCTPQYASVPSLLQCVGADGNASGLEVQLYGKKRKEYVRKKDPNAPKRTRTGYNIFFKEQRARLKQLYPDSKGHGKKVIEMWNKLPEHEKAHYISRGNEEREKYLKEYHEKMRLQNQASDATNGANISQNEHVQEHVSYDVSHDYHVSLDMENDVQSGHTDVPEMEQMYSGYHGREPQSQFLDSGMPDSHMISEDAYEGQEEEEEEGDFTQEPVSEVDEEAEMDEETYEEGEDVVMYSESHKAFDQQTGVKYQVQEQEYNTSKVENEYQTQGQEYAISKMGNEYHVQGQEYAISKVDSEYPTQGQDYNAIPNMQNEYQAQGKDYNAISNAGNEYEAQEQVYNGISEVGNEYPTQGHDYNTNNIGNEYHPQQQEYKSNTTNEYRAQEHDYDNGSKLGNEYQVQEQDFGISKVGNEYQAQGQEYGISEVSKVGAEYQAQDQEYGIPDVGNDYQVQEQEFGISKVGNEYQAQEQDYSNISKVENDYQAQQQEYSISDVDNEYQAQEQEYNVPKVVYESEVLHGSVASKQSSYGQESTYSHAPVQSQEYVQFKPIEAASHVQTSYPMQVNGQINYLQQAQGDSLMSNHNFIRSDGYAYSSGMQLEARDHLNIQKTQEHAVLQIQDSTTDYTSAFHQTHSVGSNIPARQVQSDQVYQERYTYNVHMPYSHIYPHPSQAFAARFPHPLYSLQLGDTQTHHYGSPFSPQVHQAQATNSDGHVYHGQDVFKHHLHK